MVRPTDCRRRRDRQNFCMQERSSLALEPEDKLRWLRRLDDAHHWNFLDDKRCCRSCGKIFSGREARVIGGTRPFGPLRVTCPNRRCASLPVDWIYTSELQPAATMRSISFGEVKIIRVLRRRHPRTQPPLFAKFADRIRGALASWIGSFSSLIKIGMRVPRAPRPTV
jgi:hypothetical protein